MSQPAAMSWEPMGDIFGDEFIQGIPYAHSRPGGRADWLLIYTEDGAGRFVSSAGSCDTQAGDAVLYVPGDPQNYSTSPQPGTWRLLWVHFSPRPHWQPWLRWPVSQDGSRLVHLKTGEVRDHFTAAMRRMIGVARRELPGARELAANALEEALLWANAVTSRDAWLTIDARVRKAIDYLVGRSREPFSLEKVARECGLSVSRLEFLFKRETGRTPQQFLERHRMQHAGQLLRLTSLSIADVAAEIGYADPFYFSSRFRRFAGISPSEHRRKRLSANEAEDK